MTDIDNKETEDLGNDSFLKFAAYCFFFIITIGIATFIFSLNFWPLTSLDAYAGLGAITLGLIWGLNRILQTYYRAFYASDRWKSRRALIYLILIPFFFAVLVIANGMLDKSPEEVFEATVLKKKFVPAHSYYSLHRGRTHVTAKSYLWLTTPPSPIFSLTEDRFEVNESIYGLAAENSTLDMHYKRGFFHIPWLVSLETKQIPTQDMNFSVTFVPPKDVTEYYLDIPDEIVKMDHANPEQTPLSTEERKKVIKIQDNENGYLQAKLSEDVDKTYELAFFKRQSGDPFVVLAFDSGDSFTFKALTENEEGWKDITKEVMPEMSMDFIFDKYKKWIAEYQKKNPNPPEEVNRKYLEQYAGAILLYRLPRKGTTIKALAGIDVDGIYGKELFELKFDGTKFQISK